jgi:molecular chaperone Hsp33
MTDGDKIVRCLIEDSRARVVVAVTTATVRQIAERHQATGPAAVALGRAATAGLLLATLTKDDEQVTLQLLGNGPLGAVTVDARSSGAVRAYLKTVTVPTAEPVASPRISLASALGAEGMVNVIRDLGMTSNFSGQTVFKSGEIDEDVENYLQKSEQIDSVLRCDTLVDDTGAVKASAGILVQTLPQAGGAALVEFLRHRIGTNAMADALLAATSELDPWALARNILGSAGETMQKLDSRPVSFQCPCSRERAGAMLAMMREEDLRAMMDEELEAKVVCKFCGGTYVFGEEDLQKLRTPKDKAN